MSEDVDVLDRKGRAIRVLIALAVGVGVAAVAGWVAYALSDPGSIEHDGVYTVQQSQRTWGFVYFITGLAFAVALTATLAVLTALARRRSRS